MKSVYDRFYNWAHKAPGRPSALSAILTLAWRTASTYALELGRALLALLSQPKKRIYRKLLPDVDETGSIVEDGSANAESAAPGRRREGDRGFSRNESRSVRVTRARGIGGEMTRRRDEELTKKPCILERAG